MSSNDMNKTVREFYKAVEGVKNKKPLGYDTQATVRRIEDGVAWVHIPDGVDETPARMTISAKEGDVVQVRIVNGRAFLVGNASAPPTDNTEAVKAIGQAGLAAEAASIARQKADEAVEDAATAHEAAAQAQDSADIAQAAAEAAQRGADDVADNLKSVVAGATTVEKAVSVMQTALEAVVDYDPTTDTTKEYFWHDANGAHVLGADSGYRNDVDSSGMKIVEVNTEDTVAEFGASGAQIGKDDESHVITDDHSLKLVDGTGTSYLYVSDRGGSEIVTESYTGDGQTIAFSLPYRTDEVQSVMVNETPKTPGDDYTVSGSPYLTTITFTTAPANDASISIECKTVKDEKAFTFGYREELNPSGAYSSTMGYLTSATETYSYAEGYATVADGISAHAEGYETIASGDYSHAQNKGTEASGDYQTAIGRYNSNNQNNVFEVGNGTSDSARSNAMTVDWSGNVKANDFASGNITLATLFNTSKMSQPSVYQSRIDNMTLYHYTIGRMCFVHGIFRIGISGAWADMAVATGFPTPAYNTSIPLTAANSSSHDSVICYINPQGSLCIHSVLAQYTWVTVSGYYQRNL